MIKSSLLILLCFVIISSCAIEKKNPEIDEPKKASQLQEILKNSTEDVLLHPDVNVFLTSSIVPIWQNNAYLYGRAMDLKTDNVYKTGFEISQKILMMNEDYDYKRDYDNSFLNDYEKIDIPNNEDFCSLREIDCFSELMKHFPEILNKSKHYEELQYRYESFIAYEYFSDPVLWVLESNFPLVSYRVLTNGIKIKNIHWLEELMRGNKELIIPQIYAEAIAIKRLLAQADSLIAKMVFAYLYSEHLELVNVALAMKWLTIEDISNLESLSPLTSAELSTQKAWHNEEKVKMRMLQNTLHKDQADNILIDLFYPELPPKMVKPNLILNTLYFNFFKPLMAYMDLLPDEYYQGLSEFNIHITFDEIENPVGTLLNISPDQVKDQYLEYQARIFSLNMKAQLLRALVEQGTYESVISKANIGHKAYLNHFDQSPPIMDENQICYSGIFEGNKGLRCLNIIKSQ